MLMFNPTKEVPRRALLTSENFRYKNATWRHYLLTFKHKSPSTVFLNWLSGKQNIENIDTIEIAFELTPQNLK